MKEQNHPNVIKIRNAHVHNLKHIDVDIPLNKIVGIAGVSGSGKSSLALGVLYAEGSRRYLDALSTYTRRRMTQAPRAQVDEVLHIPAALALHQRPGVPGIRSTFGIGSELLNTLRLMFSRLANHSSKLYNSKESSASTHICKFSSRYNLAYSNGSSIASDVKAQSDPGVVFKFFSASQQSMRSIYPAQV